MKPLAHAIYAVIYVLCMGIPAILKAWGIINRSWFDVACLGVLFALVATAGVVVLAGILSCVLWLLDKGEKRGKLKRGSV